jgi:hypothetical protein
MALLQVRVHINCGSHTHTCIYRSSLMRVYRPFLLLQFRTISQGAISPAFQLSTVAPAAVRSCT